MKKLLSTLVLTFALTCHAGIYFPGAWYATVQKPAKQAGAIEVTFFPDHTMEFDIYFGGEYLETVNGTYVETVKFFTFTVTDSAGWVWTGKLTKTTGQLLGTFRSPNVTRGKIQASRAEDGE